MLRRYWLVAPLILSTIGGVMFEVRSASFATPVAAAPFLLRSLGQGEPVVEMTQGKQIPWDYSDKVLRGPAYKPGYNCKGNCGRRHALCLERNRFVTGQETTPLRTRARCARVYNLCLTRCTTPGGPPLYPPPELRSRRR